jgi:hypothetical protein
VGRVACYQASKFKIAQYSPTVAALITGVLSALVALASALWAARTSRSVARIQATTARELAESSDARLDRERADSDAKEGFSIQ